MDTIHHILEVHVINIFSTCQKHFQKNQHVNERKEKKYE